MSLECKFRMLKQNMSPSWCKIGLWTWRCWWVAAEGNKEFLSKRWSDHKPARVRWKERWTPADQSTESACWKRCPPALWRTQKHNTIIQMNILLSMWCYKLLHSHLYLRGNSTRTSTATLMRRSNSVSLYISCPMSVSQHCVIRQEWRDKAGFHFHFS